MSLNHTICFRCSAKLYDRLRYYNVGNTCREGIEKALEVWTVDSFKNVYAYHKDKDIPFMVLFRCDDWMDDKLREFGNLKSQFCRFAATMILDKYDRGITN